MSKNAVSDKTSGRAEHLSPRELDVLRLVAIGFSAKEVAIELSIAPRTVEHHLDRARLKTNTRNRAHMVAHALHTGLITSD